MYKHTNAIQSTANSAKGIRHGVSGRNFRILLLVGAITLGAAFWLPLITTERMIIILTIGLMLSAELFNSAIEELADVLIQEHHPGIARVKEMAAGAVLILGIAAIIIGLRIFLPYL